MTILDVPADHEEWTAYAVERGWSDGLPLVPPTRERVEAALSRIDLDPAHPVGEIPPSGGVATVEKVAANAVMAGCAPSLLPLVVTAIEAICEPRFGLAAVQATTNPAAIALVVNGPARVEHDIAFAGNCLGSAPDARVALGRAVRLVVRNVGCGDDADAATQGQPAKLGFVWGENEEANPWAPLHVERGFAPGASTVTAIPVSGTQNMLETSGNADELMRALGTSVRSPTGNDYMFASEPWLVLCPEHAAILAGAGFSKDAVKEAFWQAAAIPVGEFTESTKRYRLAKTWPDAWRDPELRVPVSRHPEDVALVVAGGPGCHSTFLPTIGVTASVTRAVTCERDPSPKEE